VTDKPESRTRALTYTRPLAWTETTDELNGIIKTLGYCLDIDEIKLGGWDWEYRVPTQSSRFDYII
jgi:hypothetical protein